MENLQNQEKLEEQVAKLASLIGANPEFFTWLKKILKFKRALNQLKKDTSWNLKITLDWKEYTEKELENEYSKTIRYYLPENIEEFVKSLGDNTIDEDDIDRLLKTTDLPDIVKEEIRQLWSNPQVRQLYIQELSERQENFEQIIYWQKRLKEVLKLERKIKRIKNKILEIKAKAYFERRPITANENAVLTKLYEALKKLNWQKQELLSKKEIALAYRLYTLRKYHKQLNNGGFVLTPSRQAYIEEIQEKFLEWKKLLLSWPTGTGKTALAVKAVKEIQTIAKLSGKKLAKEINNLPENTRNELVEVLSGNAGVRVSDFIAKIKLIPDGKWGIKTETELWKLLKAFVEGKIPIIDEIDLIPNDVLMRIKHLLELKPGDKYSPQEWQNEVYTLQNTTLIATANIKSEKHPDREELDPAIVRLFENMPVNYFDENELYDLILAMLMERQWFISGVSKEDLDKNGIIERFIHVVKDIENLYMWFGDGVSIYLDWRQIDKLYLQKAVLETWKLLWFFKWFRASHQELPSYLKNQIIGFVSNQAYPKEDRLILLRTFSAKGLINKQDAPTIADKMLDVSLEEIEKNILDGELPQTQEVKFVDAYELTMLDPFEVRNFDELELADEAKALRNILVGIDAKLLGLEVEEDEKYKKRLEEAISELLDQKEIQIDEKIANQIMEDLVQVWLVEEAEKLWKISTFKPAFEKIKKENPEFFEKKQNEKILKQLDKKEKKILDNRWFLKFLKKEKFSDHVEWIKIEPQTWMVAISVWENTILIYDKNGKLKVKIDDAFDLHADIWPHIDFNPQNPNQIAYIAKDYKVKIYDIEKKEVIWEYEHEGWVYSVSWSPNGKYLASWWRDKKVKIYDIEKKEVIWEYEHDDRVTSVSWSPNGKYLASWWGDNVKIYDIEKKEVIWEYEHDKWVTSVSWSWNGKYLASWWGDKKVKVKSLDEILKK